MVQLDTNGKCASFFVRICLDRNLRSPGRGSKCATELPKYPSVKKSKYPKNTYKVSYNVKYNVPTHLICTALELNDIGNDTCIENGDL